MEGSRPRRSPQPSLLCTSMFCSPDFSLCSCRPRASPMASRAGQPRGRPTGCPGSLPGGQAHCSPRETHGTQKGERGSLATTSAERSQVDTSATWWNLTAFSGTARLGTACTCARLRGTGFWGEVRAAKGAVGPEGRSEALELEAGCSCPPSPCPVLAQEARASPCRPSWNSWGSPEGVAVSLLCTLRCGLLGKGGRTPAGALSHLGPGAVRQGSPGVWGLARRWQGG